MAYDPKKDPAVAKILEGVDAIVQEEHAPVEYRIQRLAVVRDQVRDRILGLKKNL